MPTLKPLRSSPGTRKSGPGEPSAGSRVGKAKTSTARTLLKHAGRWIGGDLEARLAEAYAARARANF
jgi:hypothetical protein